MYSHSLSYLFPASGFPPLANRTDQSSGAGGEGGGPSKGVENIRIRAIAKGLGFPPLLRLRRETAIARPASAVGSGCGGWKICNHHAVGRELDAALKTICSPERVPRSLRIPVWVACSPSKLSSDCSSPTVATTRVQPG